MKALATVLVGGAAKIAADGIFVYKNDLQDGRVYQQQHQLVGAHPLWGHGMMAAPVISVNGLQTGIHTGFYDEIRTELQRGW